MSNSRKIMLMLAGVAVATLVRWHFNAALHDKAPFFVFILATIFSTWIAGFWGGIATTVMGIGIYFVMAVAAPIGPGPAYSIAKLISYSVIGLIVSTVGQSLISSKRKAEKNADDANSAAETLRLVMDAASVGTWHWEISTDKLVWSDTMYALNGLTGNKVCGYEGYINIVHPDDRDRVRTEISTALANKSDLDMELRVVWPDGSEHWQVARGHSHYDAHGNAVSMRGIAIEITARKLAEQEANARAANEKLIADIEHAWRTTLDGDEIHQFAATALGNALQLDRCYYTAFDLTNDSVAITSEYLADGMRPLAGQYRIGDLPVDPLEYFPDGRTLVVEDVLAWDAPQALIEAFTQMQIRSMVVVPKFDRGRLIATLTAAMASQQRVWTDGQARLVESVAVHTRLAVEFARVRRREHRIATELQAALMPDIPHAVPGLQLASHMAPALDEASIGGDFFDVFALDKNRYAIVIGDVSGKGLAAGAQLATMRNMLRGCLYSQLSPARAATQLNTIFTTHGLIKDFVTAVIAIYSCESGALTYTTCGHEPGLILRADGRIEALHGDGPREWTQADQMPATHPEGDPRPGGPPLGIAEWAQYIDCRVTLHEGDTLVLYTDGLTEAGPNRREMLGVDGLCNLLSKLPADSDLANSAQSLIAQAADYSQIGFSDDVCVLIAKRRA